MTPSPAGTPGWIRGLAVGLGPLLGALGAVLLGKDLNWDLLNYHYYLPYAWGGDRYGLDLAPGGLQSYFNPLLDLPFFLLATRVPDRVAGAALGAVQGLNLSLLVLVGAAAAGERGRERPGVLAAALVAAGLLGAAYPVALGSTTHDATVSLGVMGAAWILLRAGYAAPDGGGTGLAAAGAAGLWLGLWTGLKPTQAVLVPALGLALLATAPSLRVGLARAGGLGAGAVLGFVVAYGPWGAFAWGRWGNPFFPAAGDWFGTSGLASIKPVLAGDGVYAAQGPKGLGQLLAWPLVMVAEPGRVRTDWVDPRLALVFVGALAAGLLRVGRGAGPGPGEARWVEPGACRFLGVATLAGVWGFGLVFPYHRFMVGLELLAPLVLVGLVEELAPSVRRGAPLVVVLALVGPDRPWARDGNLNPRTTWSGTAPWFRPDFSFLPAGPAPLFVILSAQPVSFLIPGAPPEARWIRYGGRLVAPGTGLHREAGAAIAGHPGPVWVVGGTAGGAAPGTWRIPPELGLALDPGGCREVIEVGGTRVVACPCARLVP